MFCRASKMSCTYMSEAVPGMSCIRPEAPLRESACASKLLSAWATARTSASGMLYLRDASVIHAR